MSKMENYHFFLVNVLQLVQISLLTNCRLLYENKFYFVSLYTSELLLIFIFELNISSP